MAGYSEDVIERVREANDIVSVVGSYVPLKRKGANYWGICPFHKEKSPSFSVNEDLQIFKCFGCGAGGNVFTFIMRVENYGFPDAVKFLAERARIRLDEGTFEQNKAAAEREILRKKILEMNKTAARFFYDSLMSERGGAARAYLDRRRVAREIRVKYGLGYSPDGWTALTDYLREKGYDDGILLKGGLVSKSDKRDGVYDKFRGRLMFPIFDSQGAVVGFGGRVIGEGEPKYLNSPETPVFDKGKNLYSVNFARKERSDTAIVAEGYMDVISLYQYGFKTAVAALGTAFGAGHVAALKKICKKVVLLFDSDEAGQKAAFRAIGVLGGSGLEIKVLRLKGAKDPDEFLKKFGAEAFQAALDTAPDAVMFKLNAARDEQNVDTTEGKLKFAKNAAAIIAGSDSEIERDIYSREAVKMADIDVTALNKEIEKKAAVVRLSRDADEKKFIGITSKAAEAAKGGVKAIDEARRHIVYRLTQSAYFEAIAAAVTAGEMIVGVYIKMFEVISEKVKAGEVIKPAALVGLFGDAESQQTASNVFSEYWYEDVGKALNDHIRLVKRAYCEEMIRRAGDEDRFGDVMLWQKRLNAL